MLKAYSRAWCEIDYDAIAHNVDEVRKLVGNTKIIGIVKANAYGLGAVECSRALQKAGIRFFGVSSVDEAVELRENGIEDDILILGYTPPEHFGKLVRYGLIQSLVSNAYAHKLEEYAAAGNATIRAHAKLDTGMNRTGIIYQPDHKHFDELKDVYHLDHIRVEGIFSHFPVSDDLNEDAVAFTKRQIELFDEAIERLKAENIDPGARHIQNSYGILNYMDLGYDYCRPGLLYMGVTSDDEVEIQSAPDFIPILSIYANVSVVKWLKPGETVSYGRHFKAEKPTKVATVSIGYADGLPRILSNQGLKVRVNGVLCELIGNICMDQCMVDVTDVENVQEGDVVCFIGEGLTVDRITRAAHTINNETLTSIAARMPRLEKRNK
ncbi:alanine racemase [uncultured Dubosiella sp.]|jgi:alanine racemase|uniref:alanine racemase n=1 Tax=uncultured Dubosiella sp. TaxID=1937011 RepID=UPI00208D42A5|nr:alanine racemase [uncultured Dubosiella sp.]GJM56683.1 alanine racemase 1 [Erysipelotrichaceae bacterium OPF54]